MTSIPAERWSLLVRDKGSRRLFLTRNQLKQMKMTSWNKGRLRQQFNIKFVKGQFINYITPFWPKWYPLPPFVIPKRTFYLPSLPYPPSPPRMCYIIYDLRFNRLLRSNHDLLNYPPRNLQLYPWHRYWKEVIQVSTLTHDINVQYIYDAGRPPFYVFFTLFLTFL